MEQEAKIISILSREKEPSPGLPEPARPAEKAFVFERLEYGKLCTTEDGPIEPGVESYPLATSDGFPALVEPLCRPWILGFGPEMAQGSPYGTVMRCALVEGSSFQVFCRLRQRPEKGEGKPGRCFWRGRYLCCREGLPAPFTGFEALQQERFMPGITIRQAKARERWAPIREGPLAEIGPLLNAFLQEALEYVLSGIPVGIAGGIDEPSFFRQATALWLLLPPPLRVLFSAGWAVPPSEAASLHLSAAPQFSSSIAVFDISLGQWHPPARVDQIQADGEVRSRPFEEELLVPGRMFLREAFEWTSEGRARLDDLAPRLDHLEGFDYGIRASKDASLVVDARSAWARERFRRPGLRSLDHARSVELKSWLDGTWGGDPATLCLATSQYFFPDARRQVFAHGFSAMAQPEMQSRGDEVVWKSLTEDASCHSILDPEDGAPSPFALFRARLMRALVLGGWRAVLPAFKAAIEQQAALALPAQASARLSTGLTSSLEDMQSLPYHIQFLKAQAVPEPYRAWAVARAARLAVALGMAEQTGAEEALKCLRKISSDQAVTALQRLHLRRAPTEGDIVNLTALAPEDAEFLTRNLLALWQRKNNREDREMLFPWVRPEPILLRLAQSDSLLATLHPWPLDPGQKASILQGVLGEIQGDHVPESLEARVAAVVLEYWALFQANYNAALNNSATKKPWQRLVGLWPPEAAFALAGIDTTGRKHDSSPEIQRILRDLRLPADTLDKLIADHVERTGKEVAGKASRLLWDLCSRCLLDRPGLLTAAEICRYLANGEFPGGDPPEGRRQTLVIKLAHSVPGLKLPDPLWAQAIQGWQIHFFLELAPAAGLEPTQEQLLTLIREEREWLRVHLASYPKRKPRFAIASADFHTLQYPTDGWKNEYQQGPFWAAFRGVPLKFQGSLREAIAIYSDGHPEMIPVYAMSYLDGQFKRASLEPNLNKELFQRIARAVFAPKLYEGHLGTGELEEIFRQGNGKKPTFLGPKVSFGAYGRAFSISEQRDEIFVDARFKELIEKVDKLDAQKIVLAEVRRVLEKRL